MKTHLAGSRWLATSESDKHSELSLLVSEKILLSINDSEDIIVAQMTLSTGVRLGSYEVLAAVGAGGMGEVYLSRDSTLGRDVAIKVLPEAFARDAERMARFHREAKLLAALNHTNIASIYGIEDTNGTRALVMEYVDGPTLADRIHSGPIPVDEALPIARQIADALEYAHEHGIVHRDLKPANVKVTSNDAVKVLDFGLAKVVQGGGADDPDIGNSPTISHLATQVGVFLGTAAYMSPEQAKGKSVDRRTDIWAFGCVFYEMLTGKKAFEGETISDVLAAVIRGEPDWGALPETTPPAIQRLVRRCLQKDVRQRLQAIGDARIAIEETLAGGVTAGLAGQTAAGLDAPGETRPLLRRVLPWALAAASVVAAMLLFLLRPSPPGPPLRKFEMNAGNLAAGLAASPEISPDGKAIAYLSNNDLFVRNLDQLEARKLYSLSRPDPIFWSPDSESIGFADQGKLWQIPVAGGAPREICTLPARIISSAWGANGTIFFSAWRGDMYKVPASGGDAKALGLQDPKTEVDFHDLSILPNGQDLLYVVHLIDGLPRVEVYEGGKQKTVFSQSGWRPWGARYSPTGHLLFMRDLDDVESIWAVPFSLSQLRTTGQPFMVSGDGEYPSVASDRTLLYVKPAAEAETQLVWVSRSGKIQGTVGTSQKGLTSPALSPDGRRVALNAVDSDGKRNLFVYDVASGIRTPLLSSSPDHTTPTIGAPLWMPDGKDISFTSAEGVTGQKIMLVSSDGSGQPRALLTGIVGQMSPQGNFLAYTLQNADGTFRTCYATFSNGKLEDNGAKPLCLSSASARDDRSPRISPDGRYVAFVASSGGRNNVYVTHFPDGNGRWQVSTNGGVSPVWSPRGDELFYVSGDEFMSVKVTTQPSLSLSAPVKLFSLADTHLMRAASAVAPLSGTAFDVSANGQSFLMVQQVGQAPQTSMVIDQNWFAEFSKNRGD